MIEVYKVNVSVEDSNSSNVSTKYFMTLEKACEYLEEQREYYFDEDLDSDSESDEESDSDSEYSSEEEFEESKKSYRERDERKNNDEEIKEEENKEEGDDYSEDSDYPDEEVTLEFLTSLFNEDDIKFRPRVVFEHYIDEEYVTATISKIFINN
jgi:hypothetical protein